MMSKTDREGENIKLEERLRMIKKAKGRRKKKGGGRKKGR